MKRLYTLPLPESAQPTATDAERIQLAEAGLLNVDASTVEQLSADPSEQTLSGQWRFGRPYARVIATELEELAQASGFEAVPLFRAGDTDTELAGAGYYSVRDAETEPAHAAAEDVYRYDVTLSSVGTHDTHLLGVQTNPVDVASANPFATTDGAAATLTVPESARKRQWTDPKTPTRDTVDDASDIVETEHGPLARYPLADGQASAGVDRPTLLYELSYVEQGPTDVVVWDDRDRSEKLLALEDGVVVGSDTATVGGDGAIVGGGTGPRTWQHVFSSEHEFADSGDAVVDTGRLRLRFNEPAGVIVAERWDAVDKYWADVEVPYGDWLLFDVDLKRISPLSVEAQVTFENGVDGGLYDVDMHIQRGMAAALWTVPANEGPMPADLETLLEPLAVSWETDPRPSLGLVSRREIEQ